MGGGCFGVHPHPNPPPSRGRGPKAFLPPLRGKVGMGAMPNAYARTLRKNLTDAEQRMWNYLRLRQLDGVKFRRQQPLGAFIVDFVCFERKLIVEVDGGQHSERCVYDENRRRWLEGQGYRVLRFWN